MSLNSIYVRDSALMLPDGYCVQMCLREACRIGEPAEAADYLEQLGVPLAFEIQGDPAAPAVLTSFGSMTRLSSPPRLKRPISTPSKS